MPIPTSRTSENGQITIDNNLCNGCGLCVEVCGDQSLEMHNGKAIQSQTPVFGCFACGQCMAVCPRDAIVVEGRTLSATDIFSLAPKTEMASYNKLLNLLQARRSVRKFKDKTVDKELIGKVVDAARTAPMGLPPSDVNVLIMDNKEKVHQFAKDFCEYLENLKWFVSDWFLNLMKPFRSKKSNEMFREFLKPLVEKYTGGMKEGNNYVTYDAPAALYFYGSEFSDPADPIVSATYAMIAAESLGLATCMIGGVHPFLLQGPAAQKFRAKQNIRYKSKEGLIVIMGYPRVKFKKGIKRSFANTDFSTN